MKRLTIILLAFLLVGCEKGVDKDKETSIPKTENISKEEDKPVVNEPVEEPIKALTEEEDKYLDIVTQSLDVYVEHYEQIQKLIDEAQSNSSIMKDNNWIKGIQENFTMIYFINGTFKKMTETNNVPVRMEGVHAKAQECFTLMSLAGDRIDNSLEEAQALIDSSSAKIDEISSELDKIIVEIN